MSEITDEEAVKMTLMAHRTSPVSRDEFDPATEAALAALDRLLDELTQLREREDDFKKSRVGERIETLERSRADLRERNRMLKAHDDCDWRHKVRAKEAAIVRLVAQLRVLRSALERAQGLVEKALPFIVRSHAVDSCDAPGFHNCGEEVCDHRQVCTCGAEDVAFKLRSLLSIPDVPQEEE